MINTQTRLFVVDVCVDKKGWPQFTVQVAAKHATTAIRLAIDAVAKKQRVRPVKVETLQLHHILSIGEAEECVIEINPKAKL